MKLIYLLIALAFPAAADTKKSAQNAMTNIRVLEQIPFSGAHDDERLAKDTNTILTGDPIMDDLALRQAARDRKEALDREAASKSYTSKDIYEERKEMQEITKGDSGLKKEHQKKE